MKTATFTFILAVCALLTGCKNSVSPLTQEEEKLVGKYYIIMSEDMAASDTLPPISIMLEGYTRYAADRTCEQSGTAMMAIKALDQLQQQTLTLEYGFTARSSWRIENGYIKGNANPESIEWKFLKSNAETEQARMFVKRLTESTAITSFKLKASIMNAEDSDTRIVELTDEKLVVEEDGGEQITLVRTE